MEIGLASEQMIDSVVRLRIKALSELGFLHNKTHVEQYKAYERLRGFLEETINRGVYVPVVIDKDYNIVSFAVLQIYNVPEKSNIRYADITSLYTVKEHRNKGYARMILDYIEDSVKDINLTFCNEHDDERSKDIYRKMNMQEVLYFTDNEASHYWYLRK